MVEPLRTDDSTRAILARTRDSLAALTGADREACAPVLREIGLALQRLEADGEPAAPRKDLISIICHDLKDPLSSIVMGAGYLRKVLPQDEASASARRVVEAIHRSSERMNQVISDFHDLGKLEAGRLPIDVRSYDAEVLVRAALDQLLAAAKDREIDLGAEVEAGDVRVRCDRARVLQMFAKLVGNALKFTPKGGKVVVSAARRGDVVRFAVRDTGRGVPEARKPTVFDRDVNAAQTPRDGPGLGLAIVKELARLQGGDVGVEDNVEGPGVTFWFTLPVG